MKRLTSRSLPTRTESTRRLLALLALALIAGEASAQIDPDDEFYSLDLSELSLEELLDIDVSIASRSAQKLSEVPGAAYVITGDEIRRAGHTSIQEALRMVPGFYVSNWTTSSWDVTSRGFGPGLSLSSLAYLNQLLVMIDGVVVYTPLFAGTWWALQDVNMADVDRIEVIRGPGGILWGSNAVHGVVNVIMKHSADTLGPQVSARHQTGHWNAGGRFGGRIGDDGTFRFFAKKSGYDSNDEPFLGFDQGWEIATTGFRFDWGGEDERRTSLWGRAYEGEFGADGFDLVNFVPIPVEDRKSGFQIAAKTTDEDGKGTWSAWLSRDQQSLPTELHVDIITADVEYKRDFELSERTKLTGGVGMRQIHSDLEGPDPFYIDFVPGKDTQSVFRAFAVCTWDVPDANMDVVVGSQLERNDFTGFELQPTARLNWHPTDDFAAWAAITRSVRTPSLEELHLGGFSVFVGSQGFDVEKVLTYEVGVRKQLGEAALLDVAAFFNDYDDLHDATFDPATFQQVLSNGAEGESYGIEIAADFKPLDHWSLRSAYTVMSGKYRRKVDGADVGTEEYHPRHLFNLRSYYDLGDDWELDTGVYLYESFGEDFDIAERTRVDARIGWHPNDSLELYIGGQQLNRDQQSEFDVFDQVHRQVYAGLSWSPGSDDS